MRLTLLELTCVIVIEVAATRGQPDWLSWTHRDERWLASSVHREPQNASSHERDSRIAAEINPTMLYVCTKLPHASPVTGSKCSARSP